MKYDQKFEELFSRKIVSFRRLLKLKIFDLTKICFTPFSKVLRFFSVIPYFHQKCSKIVQKRHFEK